VFYLSHGRARSNHVPCASGGRVPLEERLLGKLRTELLQPESIDLAIESFGRQLRSSLANVSNELTEMRSRKEKLEREIRNFTQAIAENGHSKYILEEIAIREKEISGITDRLLSSTPDSIQNQIDDVRRLVEDGIQNLHRLCREDSPAAKQELHKHLSAVRMYPLEDGDGWYYIAEGTWDLLGIDPHAPKAQVPEGRIRMVAGVDLNHRPLGYENGSHPLSAVESIAPKAKLTVQNRFWRLKCWRFQGVGTAKVCRLIRRRF
jgi:hypothetical protein